MSPPRIEHGHACPDYAPKGAACSAPDGERQRLEPEAGTRGDPALDVGADLRAGPADRVGRQRIARGRDLAHLARDAGAGDDLDDAARVAAGADVQVAAAKVVRVRGPIEGSAAARRGFRVIGGVNVCARLRAVPGPTPPARRSRAQEAAGAAICTSGHIGGSRYRRFRDSPAPQFVHRRQFGSSRAASASSSARRPAASARRQRAQRGRVAASPSSASRIQCDPSGIPAKASTRARRRRASAACAAIGVSQVASSASDSARSAVRRRQRGAVGTAAASSSIRSSSARASSARQPWPGAGVNTRPAIGSPLGQPEPGESGRG